MGTQYRSVVFYHNEDQKNLAEKYMQELDASGSWDQPIVTQIEKLDTFYRAEDSHQDYYRSNSGQTYCSLVIQPKLEKFKKVFADKMVSP